MVHLRAAYSPTLVKLCPARPSRRVIVGVGADATMTAPPAAAARTVKERAADVLLYMALPAAGVGIIVGALGGGYVVVTLGTLLGALGGGYALGSKIESEENAAIQDGKAASDAREKELRAHADVAAIALQTDAIGVQTAAGLKFFSIGYVPTTPGEAGSIVDYKLATFATVPTDAVVKQLTDLSKLLADNGYTRASAQIADAAATAAHLAGGGTVATIPT
jgi:hypothetical protein